MKQQASQKHMSPNLLIPAKASYESEEEAKVYETKLADSCKSSYKKTSKTKTYEARLNILENLSYE